MTYCTKCGTRIRAQWKYCINCGTRNHMTGKTSTRIDKDGYRRFKDSNKLVHRYVIEKSLGRELSKDEVIHHINLKKLDNRPENLMLFPKQKTHERFHENLDHSKCPECRKYLVKKKGKYGAFWGCTGYPNCRYTRPLPSK